MATMTFESITEQGPDQMDKQAGQIEDLLTALPGIQIQREPTRPLHFPPEPGRSGNQWRTRFYVMKQPGRTQTTWNQVYDAVNSIKAAYYKFL